MQQPAFSEALSFWIKLGFISFGGPAGQIAIMHEYLIDKKKWISESRFLHALNYCMLLPGPEAQQLATYIGWKLHGIRGGLAAGVFFVLPSMLILLILSMIYVSYGSIPAVAAVFNGLKPAIIAIVALALLKISKKALRTPVHYLIAIAAFLALHFLKISFPLVIIGSVSIAILLQWKGSRIFVQKQVTAKTPQESEQEYFINSNSPSGYAGFNWRKLLSQGLIFLACWFIPFIIIGQLPGAFSFWKDLILFFTKAAFVTVGGAYAVLPYVAQVSVENHLWLTNLQMIDGLALGETTPGPLIMVLTFVGFMAGYNQFDQSLIYGSLGLITTTYYTFLPCFFFIFAGGPIIEKYQENERIKGALSLVTAAVVGVILNLTFYIGEAVLFQGGFSAGKPDYLSMIWAVLSFLFISYFKVGMIPWICISGVYGWLVFLAGW